MGISRHFVQGIMHKDLTCKDLWQLSRLEMRLIVFRWSTIPQ